MSKTEYQAIRELVAKSNMKYRIWSARLLKLVAAERYLCRGVRWGARPVVCETAEQGRDLQRHGFGAGRSFSGLARAGKV